MLENGYTEVQLLKSLMCSMNLWGLTLLLCIGCRDSGDTSSCKADLDVICTAAPENSSFSEFQVRATQETERVKDGDKECAKKAEELEFSPIEAEVNCSAVVHFRSARLDSNRTVICNDGKEKFVFDFGNTSAVIESSQGPVNLVCTKTVKGWTSP